MPHPIDATILGLGNAYQGFLGNSIDSMIVYAVSNAKPIDPTFLAWNSVSVTVHRNHPIAGDALVRAVAVARLIAGFSGDRATIGTSFVSFHRTFAGDPARMFS
ncbi:MAG: hypothetical protein R3C56_25930 [Pirellulaceae bacterium]